MFGPKFDAGHVDRSNVGPNGDVDDVTFCSDPADFSGVGASVDVVYVAVDVTNVSFGNFDAVICPSGVHAASKYLGPRPTSSPLALCARSA